MQECVGEGVSITVPDWWAVSIAEKSIGTATDRIVDNVDVMASSESRPRRRAVVYGISVITILRQFQRRPSRLVNQREKECL